ncbi:uncharacterized protein FPRO_04496 [Fusarium proliferatum ET1]|uniref:Uncharacterized protein n=1 Tax=Fusarium proliferatum (strain ET1) TaxID=1227346 RepID=A0A1L7VG24_FUSPR|nr:uncharacterized protein FPRO_04496 [Fusarium proliferatum ET1]CZR39599.1 uncharacterized protein FPRO_04496 [Fusarium proliferatum ET1]
MVAALNRALSFLVAPWLLGASRLPMPDALAARHLGYYGTFAVFLCLRVASSRL